MVELWIAIRLTVLWQRMGGYDRIRFLRVVTPSSYRWWLIQQLVLLEDEQ